jgi:hypothetical protein
VGLVLQFGTLDKGHLIFFSFLGAS